MPRMGPARHRPEPGRRLRRPDAGDRARPAARQPLRLRRDVRDRAQPLLRPGGGRASADRVRARRPDPRLPRHPRHRALHRADDREPAQARRVPGVQPVHRAVQRPRARRPRRGRRTRARPRRGDLALPQPADRGGGALLQREAQPAPRSRARPARAVGDPARLSRRRRDRPFRPGPRASDRGPRAVGAAGRGPDTREHLALLFPNSRQYACAVRFMGEGAQSLSDWLANDRAPSWALSTWVEDLRHGTIEPAESPLAHSYISTDSAPPGYAVRRATWTAPALLASFAGVAALVALGGEAIGRWYAEALGLLTGVSRAEIAPLGETISIRPFALLLFVLLALFASGSRTSRLRFLVVMCGLYASLTLLADVILVVSGPLGSPGPFSSLGGIVAAILALLTGICAVLPQY